MRREQEAALKPNEQNAASSSFPLPLRLPQQSDDCTANRPQGDRPKSDFGR
jgi:hypothetical protein